jgi:hypothetical protein
MIPPNSPLDIIFGQTPSNPASTLDNKIPIILTNPGFRHWCLQDLSDAGSCGHSTRCLLSSLLPFPLDQKFTNFRDQSQISRNLINEKKSSNRNIPLVQLPQLPILISQQRKEKIIHQIR